VPLFRTPILALEKSSLPGCQLLTEAEKCLRMLAMLTSAVEGLSNVVKTGLTDAAGG
jgi:hypothetical protein